MLFVLLFIRFSVIGQVLGGVPDNAALWGALALIRRVSPLKLLKLFHLLLTSVESCFIY